MGDAVGETLPLAIGAALSPFPIIAVVLMLVTPKAKVNGPAYLAGWFLGLVVLGGIVLAISSGADASSDDNEPATWVSLLELLVGVILVLMASKQWKSRPRGDDEVPTPKWMGSLDHFNAGKAFLAGTALAAANPKNLLLSVAAAASIAGSSITDRDQAIAYLIYCLIASIGVAVPVAISFLLGSKSKEVLGGIKDWLAHNNAVIMAVILLLIGFKIIGDAIAGLT